MTIASLVCRTLRAAQRVSGLRIDRIVAMSLSDAGSMQARCAGLECRELTEADALAHASHELELSPALVRTAYARGDVCIGAFEGGRMVGYQWVAFSDTPDTGDVWVSVPAGAFYAYKRFVAPAWRGRRIAASLQQECNAVARARGCDRGIAYINMLNMPSWRAAQRDGARSVGNAACWRLGGAFLAARSAGARRHGFAYYRPRRGTPAAAHVLTALQALFGLARLRRTG